VNWKALQADVAYLPPGRRRVSVALTIVFGLALAALAVGLAHLWVRAASFPRTLSQRPSRLYARPHRLAPGDPLSAPALAAELAAAGYRELGAGAPTGRAGWPAGTFRLAGDRLAVQLRCFPTPRGSGGGLPLEVAFRDGRIARLRLGGREVPEAELEPPLLASFYGPDRAEHRPVTLAELPREVVQAVLAAEDRGFFEHAGFSLASTGRALLADLRNRHAHQGGSTITQQLVKNLYLSPRRTLARKAEEAILAMLLEIRQGKRAILETYLNEIYWGRRGGIELRGLGAASRGYFGKEPAALTLGEAAALAGMIRSPAEHSPLEHPAAARARRDQVLRRLAELGWIDRERVRRALAEPLAAAPDLPAGPAPAGPPAYGRQPASARPLAPFFADAAAAEARARYGIQDLGGGGYLLFSTLDLADQRQAEAAVERGMADLERDRRGGRGRAPLEAALVSVDPRDGAILAYVGGRDHRRSQFDRAGQARRQLGSAFKPVIYAAAFGAEAATPATLLDDAPVVVRTGSRLWSPQNYDRTFRGPVTARTALEQSLNVPTVRLAFRTGLEQVAALARALGLGGRLELVPALALGTVEATPRELAQVYTTFAAGGLRPVVHGLAAVIDRTGHPVPADETTPVRALRPQSAYLVNSILQGALDHGTGSGARRLGVAGPLAGKTGTTSERRDSWFAGYSPDRATVVWVGCDDDSGTDLSGAIAAVPVWSRFVRAVRPAAGWADFARPPGLVAVSLDPDTGQLATPGCPRRTTELLPEWQLPGLCQLHAPGAESLRLADLRLGGLPAAGPRLAGLPVAGLQLDGLPLTALPPAGGLEAAAAGWRQGASAGGLILIRPARRRGP
jgi:penicillin-binding protein 1B